MTLTELTDIQKVDLYLLHWGWKHIGKESLFISNPFPSCAEMITIIDAIMAGGTWQDGVEKIADERQAAVDDEVERWEVSLHRGIDPDEREDIEGHHGVNRVREDF